MSQLKVFKGAQNTVKAGFAEDFVLSLPKGMAGKSSRSQLVSQQPLLAPVQQGQRVATLQAHARRQALGRISGGGAGRRARSPAFFGRAWDTLQALVRMTHDVST